MRLLNSMNILKPKLAIISMNLLAFLVIEVIEGNRLLRTTRRVQYIEISMQHPTTIIKLVKLPHQ
jgi:hypothetical protein